MYFGQLETQSNRADWEEVFTLVDEETGDLIDITGCRITMTVRKLNRNPNAALHQGYYGHIDPGMIIMQGSTDTGEITILELGTFQWLFTQERMNQFGQGEYDIGVRIMQNGTTVQLIICTVNIVEGIDDQ